MLALRHIFCALLGLLLVACGPSSVDRDRLERAEAIVQQYPDSALAILGSITPEARNHNRFHAVSVVIEAEALYKLQRTLPSDSVITRTIQILSQRTPDSYLCRAYFLNGYRKINEGRYVDAIVDFLSAEEIARKIGDVHYAGLIQRNIADAFDKLGDKESSLLYYRKSADSFKTDLDAGYYYWALYNVARAYNNVLEYNQAIALADSLATIQQVKDNAIIYPHLISLLIQANLNAHQNAKALELYEQLRETNYLFTARDFNNIGIAYLDLGMIDKARQYSDSVKTLDPTETSLDFAIACKEKDTTNIFFLIDKDIDSTNSEFEALYKRNYAQIIDKYYQVALYERQAELGRHRSYLAAFVILASILFIGLIIIYNYTLKRKQRRIAQTLGIVAELSKNLKERTESIDRMDELAQATAMDITRLEAELDAKTEDISKLAARLVEKNNDISQMEADLHARNEDIYNLRKSLDARNKDFCRLEQSIIETKQRLEERSKTKNSRLSNHLSLINEVCSLYCSSGSNPVILYKNVERLIARNATKKKTLEIEKHINESEDNLIARFRADFPQLKESEVQLFILTVAGLQAATLALYMKVDVNAVYTRRYRLRQKIEDLNPQAAKTYLTYLE